MTQRFSYWEDLSIRENLEFVARMYEVPDPKAKVDETLERLGLVARQNQLAGELSGGWKQRLALAACMLHAPRLLLLDEPTAGVDPQARRDFWEEIHRLSEAGLTVLVSTHYMDEAERCDRIVYINLGKIIAQGTVADVDQAVGAHHVPDRRPRCAPSAVAARGQAGRRACRVLRRGAPCQRPRPQRARGGAEAAARHGRATRSAKRRRASRTCSSICRA